MDDVIAFGTPSDVVRIAESIDLERADVGRQEGEILRRGCEHVPGVKIKE